MREEARMLKLLCVLVALLFQFSTTRALHVEDQDPENVIISDQADMAQQLPEGVVTEIKTLKKELSEARRELQQSKEEIESLTDMYRFAEDALRQEKEHVGQLQGLDIKLNDKEHELVAVRAQQASLVDENKRLQAELQGLKLKDQEKVVQSLKEEIHRLKYKLEAAERHLAARTTENDALARSHEDRDRRLAQVENTLKITEAAMLAAQAEVATKGKALLQMNEQWLPPWAALHLAELETKAALCWVQHVQPAVASLGSKVKKLMEEVKEKAAPHLVTCREKLGQLTATVSKVVEPAMLYTKMQHTRLMPTVREKWEHMAEALGPQVEALRVQLKEATASTADFLRPKIEAARVAAEPHLKVAYERMKPTVDVVVETVGPHAEPYIVKAKEVAGAAKLKVKEVHSQVSRKVTAILLSHELTSGYVDKSIIWYLTTGLMLLPLLAVWIILSPYIRLSKKEGEAQTGRHRKRKPKHYPDHRNRGK